MAEGKACCCLEVLTSRGVYDERGDHSWKESWEEG